MKKFICFLSALVFISGLAGSVVAVEQKVGVVNLQFALNQVNEGKRAKAAIQAEMNTKKKELETMKTQLKAMRDQIEKEKMVLSKEALQTKMGEVQTKFVELQKKAVEAENMLKEKESTSINRILTNLRKKAVELAKSKNFDIVYENSLETVLYSSSAVDLTEELIRVYNTGK